MPTVKQFYCNMIPIFQDPIHSASECKVPKDFGWMSIRVFIWKANQALIISNDLFLKMLPSEELLCIQMFAPVWAEHSWAWFWAISLG